MALSLYSSLKGNFHQPLRIPDNRWSTLVKKKLIFNAKFLDNFVRERTYEARELSIQKDV